MNLYIILGIVAVVIIGFVILASTRPSTFVIQRSGIFNAPPQSIYEQLVDFHNWHNWSPWEKLDPNMNKQFSGAPSGPGAIFSWNGNRKAGAGKMTILEATPNEKLKIQLQFFKPMANICFTDFVITPQGGQTRLDWIMTGKNDFMGKAFCMFMNMDKMVGGDFEKGMANIKSIVEKQPV